MTRLLYWTPRIASLLFVAFVSLFALDVFGEYEGWELAFALLMHLLPTFVLLATTVIAWKYDLVGASVFLGFAAWYAWWAGLERPLSWYLSIAAPATLIGILYLANWLHARSKNES